MLVSSLWKPQITSVEYLMGHFESRPHLFSAFPKTGQMEELEKSKKCSFWGACRGNEKYKYCLVEENKNIEQSGKKSLVNSLKLYSVLKSILFLDFVLAGFWGTCGKEFCWADGELWQHWLKAFPLIYRCSLDLFSFSRAII